MNRVAYRFEPKSHLNIRIPLSMHRAFKLSCVSRGYLMSEKLLDYIESEIEKSNNQPKEKAVEK